ncbi:MAG: signal peptidase I [bacterium]|nr:signal peptidase I [bacterium]
MTKARSSIWFHLFDVVLNIVIIVGIVVAIRTFLISPFQVEGNSMLETLEHQEYIIINKLGYFIGKPDRGDIVIFRPPNEPKKHYVKRIIGLPEDKISIRNGLVYLTPAGTHKEIELDEPYLSDRNAGKTYQHPPTSGNTKEKGFAVPKGSYFLLGDNRQGSLDSRSFTENGGGHSPYVLEKNVKGRVWFIALPITKIHALELPNYGF